MSDLMNANTKTAQDPAQMVVSAIMGAYDSAGYLSEETRSELQSVLMKGMIETMQNAAKK